MLSDPKAARQSDLPIDTIWSILEAANDLGDGQSLRLQLFGDTLQNDRFVSYGFPGSYRTQIGEARLRYDLARDFGLLKTQTVAGGSYRYVHAIGKESFNSGVIALPDEGGLIVGGKDGVYYHVNRSTMGQRDFKKLIDAPFVASFDYQPFDGHSSLFDDLNQVTSTDPLTSTNESQIVKLRFTRMLSALSPSISHHAAL